MKQVTEFSNTEARRFFLKQESYFNFDLPKYFVFQEILQKISDVLTREPAPDIYGTFIKNISELKSTCHRYYENVNYKILNNKDGKFAWRPFQLIHPVIYVSLVHNITEKENWNIIVNKFGEFSKNPKIKCHSIPLESEGSQSDKATSVGQWWQLIEQQSIELALQYEYVLHTDITDCYGSIYTHSIPWAIHTKPIAKAKMRDNNLIGNVIDKELRYMSYGQTNGIPQGSVLMDFIAEIVLGYIDLELSTRINKAEIKDYQIIRYRDDFRIFSNNPKDAELITKLLTETLIEMGMCLNAQKTLISNNVVKDSLKPDKYFWMTTKKRPKNIQEHLFLIHSLAEKYPNSGSLSKALDIFFERIKGIKDTDQNIQVLVSILVDIMVKNPRVYPIGTAILSKLLALLDESAKKEDILTAILAKFEKIPNTGFIQIWLQRLTIKEDRKKIYEEKLCKKVNDSSIPIWNSEWVSDKFKELIESISIIDEQIIQDIDPVIDGNEVKLFKRDYEENSID